MDYPNRADPNFPKGRVLLNELLENGGRIAGANMVWQAFTPTPEEFRKEMVLLDEAGQAKLFAEADKIICFSGN